MRSSRLDVDQWDWRRDIPAVININMFLCCVCVCVWEKGIDIPVVLNAEWISSVALFALFCWQPPIGAQLIGSDRDDKIWPFSWSNISKLLLSQDHQILAPVSIKNSVETDKNVQSFGVKLKYSNCSWKLQKVPSWKRWALCKILKPACNWNNWQL